MAMLRCMNCMEEYNEKQNKCPHCGYMKVQRVNSGRYLLQETSLQRRYIVGNVLRENELEVIYIGWDSVLEKRIAIKEYFPKCYAQRMLGQKELSYESEEDRAQFMRGLEQFVSEAQQLARFREDTGMIRIYDNFEENGTAYTIIEYTESLRVPFAEKQPDVIDHWQQKKKVYYIGWGIGSLASLILLVLLFFENGTEVFSKEYETIPDMTGMTYQQVAGELGALGVKIEREKYCYSSNIAEDVITCQSIPAGTRVEKNMVVKVVVTGKNEDSTAKEQETETDSQDYTREDRKENTEEKTTTEEQPTEKKTPVETRESLQSTEQTTQQRVKTTTQADTRKKTTEKKTEKKTTEKRTEKKTEKKTEQEKTTEKAMTEEEVIMIEE